MERNEEYHDPDYPGASTSGAQKPSELSEQEKISKIQSIIRREFSNELEVRENEVMLIEQRMNTSRRMLFQLRYALVNSYYQDQKLQLSASQIQDEVAAQTEPRARAEVSSLLREGQRRLHPSVRKLLGKRTADLDDILFGYREPRNKVRKDYSAMLQSRNYTVSADSTKTLRPEEPEAETSKPKKQPRHLEPKVTNVVTLDEATRNQMKHRYRIIIGNTSKYAPAASRADRSTHKWLLYVRSAPPHAVLSPIVTAVTVKLHHSYAPHHTVHVSKPPYHVSRRGWGEFPAKVELHFTLPERNRPAVVEHTIKLDRNYTGLQTLGAETVVDVWLYSTPEMLPYEFKDTMETPLPPKSEPTETQTNTDDDRKDFKINDVNNYDSNEIKTDNTEDSWMDFFTNTTALDVDEMIIKPVKKEIQPVKTEIDDNDTENTQDIQNDHQIDIKIEPEDIKIENHVENQDKLDIPTEILNQPSSPKKRIMKYMDPTTGKIYYLEMDRKLDLSKVQEIIINTKGNTKTAKISPVKSNGLKSVRKPKKGISLLKPEVKNSLKQDVERKCASHIENDHNYLGDSWFRNINFDLKSVIESIEIKKEVCLYDSLCACVKRFTSLRVAVNYLLKKIPVISEEARDKDFLKHFPFVVESEQKYWKYDFAKRRNIEWSRAKTINKILTEHFPTPGKIWRTKQILIFSRFHGYYPIRTNSIQNEPQTWTYTESNIRELYPKPTDINTLTKFDCTIDQSESITEISDDEEVEVVENVVNVKKEAVVEKELTVLMPGEEDRLSYIYVERICSDIGIELRNQDVGNGFSYSAVHAVLVSAMRSYAEELVRCSLAAKLQENCTDAVPPVWTGSSSSRTVIALEHVYRGVQEPRLNVVTQQSLGTEKKETYLYFI